MILNKQYIKNVIKELIEFGKEIIPTIDEWEEVTANDTTFSCTENLALCRYLEYYLNLKNKTILPIFVNGPWGAGKTHFILSYIKRYTIRRPRILLYISCYGIDSIIELEKAILLANFQSSRGSTPSLLFPIMTSALSAIKSIIPYGNNLNLSTSDIARAWLPSPNHIIIIDDLERANIDIKNALGLISRLSEQSFAKIIVIGNQERKELSGIRESFEKTFGRTFNFHTTYQSAYISFVREHASQDSAEFLHLWQDVVLDVFKKSSTSSLRSLKQAIYEFSCFYGSVDDTYRQDTKYMLECMKLFLAISLEVKNNRINEETLRESQRTRFFISKGANEILLAYDFDLKSQILSDQILYKAICCGDFAKEEINQHFAESVHFTPKSQEPDWHIIFNFRERRKDTVSKAITDILKSVTSFSYMKPGDLLHSAASLLWLSNGEGIEEKPDYILEIFMNYLDNIEHMGDPAKQSYFCKDVISNSGYMGYAYPTDDVVFNQIIAKLSEVSTQIEESMQVKLAQFTLDLLDINVQSFCNHLSGEDADSNISTKPVLSHLPPSRFLERVLSLSEEDSFQVFHAIKRRYYWNDQLRGLESHWIENVWSEFDKVKDRIDRLDSLRIRFNLNLSMPRNPQKE